MACRRKAAAALKGGHARPLLVNKGLILFKLSIKTPEASLSNQSDRKGQRARSMVHSTHSCVVNCDSRESRTT
eukprot:1544241-Rhodomonas_salina.1